MAGGTTQSIKAADGNVFTPDTNHYWGTVYVQATGPGNMPPYWNLSISGANNAYPTPGNYPNAGSVNFGSGQPILSFSGGDTAGGGSFTVYELAFDGAGKVTQLAVDFTISDSVRTHPRLFGQLRYNSNVAIDPVIRTPDPYRFTRALNVTPGQLVTAAPVIIGGLSVPAPISISNGEYSIDGAPFTTTAGTVQSGQSVQVRAQAPATANSITRARLTVGDYYDEFLVGTPVAASPQPNGEPLIVTTSATPTSPVPFQRVISQAANYDLVAEYVSAPGGKWLDFGFYPPADSSRRHSYFRAPGTGSSNLVPGTYSLVAIYSTDMTGMGFSTDYFRCDQGYAASSTLVIYEAEYGPDGNPTKFSADAHFRCAETYNPDNYDVYFRWGSSAPIDYSLTWPLAFSFPSVTGANPGAQVVSQETVIGGINVPVAISIFGGEYSIDGGAFTSAPGTVVNLSHVRVRMSAPALYNDYKTLTLSIGGRTGTFTVTSQTGAPQPNGDPLVILYDQRFIDGGLPTVYSNATQRQIKLALASNTPGVMVQVLDPTFSTTIAVDWLQLSIANQSTLTVGEFALDGSTPAASVNGAGAFSVGSVYSGAVCDAGEGSRMHVYEARYAADGTPAALAADVELRCADGSAAHHIYIRVGSTVPIDYRSTRPLRFGFAPVSNVAAGTMATSDEALVQVINAPAPISVENGEYSINGGPFTSAPGTVTNHQRIRLRGLAPSQAASFSIVRVNVGGQHASFRIGAPVPFRPQPPAAPFMVLVKKSQLTVPAATTVFTPVNGQDITLTNPNPGPPGSYRGVQFTAGLAWPEYIGENKFVFILPPTASGDVSPGFYPGMYLDSSSRYHTVDLCFTYSAQPRAASSVRIQEVAYDATGTPTKLAMDFVVWCDNMTEAYYGFVRVNSAVPVNYQVTDPFPVYPGSFGGVSPGSVITSNTMTISGINTAVPISVSNGQYRINGGSWMSSPGVVNNGDMVQMQLPAAEVENMITTATLTVSTQTALFTVGTRPGANPQPSPGVDVIVTISQPAEPLWQGYNHIYSTATNTVMTVSDDNYDRVLVSAVGGAGNSYGVEAEIFHDPYARLQAGLYTVTSANGGAVHYRIGNCALYNVTGTLRVIEAEYDAAGALIRLAADIVQYCNGAAEPVYAYIRVNSLVPIEQVTDDVPYPFYFSPISSPPNTPLVTYPLEIQNANVTLPISVSAGLYSVDGGLFTNAPGNINPGHTVQLQLTSPPLPGRSATMMVRVGSASAPFTVTTSPDATPPAGLPGAPQVVSFSGGDSRVTLIIRPPANTGGLPILGYVISCNDDAGVDAGTANELIRTGLVNGQAYSCVVISRNANGLGGASYRFDFTPTANPALQFVGAVSRKVHGSAGVFDLPIDYWSNIYAYTTVEPRAAGDGHEIVFFFNQPVTTAGTVTLTDPASTQYGAATLSISDNSVTVKLPPIADGKRVQILLSGVNGGSNPSSASIGFLLGDINNSLSVTAADIISTKHRAGQPLTFQNFRSDIDLSGSIDMVDLQLLRVNAGVRLH